MDSENIPQTEATNTNARIDRANKKLNSEDQVARNEGFQELKAIADQGVAYAQAYVGCILRVGLFGLEKDELAAFQYLTKAVQGGDKLGAEQLAKLYFDRGDYAKALPLAQDAADSNAKCSLSAGLAGVMYFDGLGTDPDKFLGMSYFKRASDAGNLDATFLYASYLARGEGATANPEKAAMLLKALVEKSNDGDQAYELSKVYRMPPLNDIASADEWLKKAAQWGSSEAAEDIRNTNKVEKWKSLSKLYAEGNNLEFFTKIGKVVNVRVDKDTQIYTTGGYGNVPVNIQSHTSLQRVITLVDSEGVEFSIPPDSDLPIHVGIVAEVLYCGLNGGKGYPVCLVPQTGSQWFVVLRPERITKILEIQRSGELWGWLTAGSAVMLFTPLVLIGLPGLIYSVWKHFQTKGSNKSLHAAIASRTEEIANLLRQ